MQCDYVDGADANWLILKRDLDFTKDLVATKRQYGFPKTFRVSYTKNSNDAVWQAANILHDAGMLKSVTLAMQSMDDGVLKAIHRKNIKFDHFGELVKRYTDAGISTYTELIIGLPLESLASFIDGVARNLESGQHSGLFCYVNISLPNTEQSKPEYVSKYGLRTVPMKAMLSHGTPANDIPIELQDTIVETAAMPHEDWKKAWLFAKAIEVFHAQGLLQLTAIWCREQSIPYQTFYKSLLTWLDANHDTVAGREFSALKRLLDGALAGGSWDCVDPRMGEISWPPEEFAFGRICFDLATFYDEIDGFLDQLDVPESVRAEQRAQIKAPPADRTEEWSKLVVFYGRKGNAAKLRREGI